MTVTRREFLATTTALSVSRKRQPRDPQELRARLLGAWQLINAVTVYPSGSTGPWYQRPGPYTGLLIYSNANMMSVQIASARPPVRGHPEFMRMSESERVQYLDTYYAYFGSFEVDAATSEVRHRIESSLDPAEVGLTYTQKVSIATDRLTLTTQPWRVGSAWWHSRLTWRRS